MWSDPNRARQWRQDHAEGQKAYARRRRTAGYGPPATPDEQQACLADPRKSLESKFGIVTPEHVLCMLCWHRYQELGHHLGQCEKRAAAWHGQKNLPDLYRDLVGFNHETALACEAVRAERGETANKHGLSGYAKKDPNRKELLDRNRPSNIGRKHSRQARLNKADRQRGRAFPERQTVSHESYVRQFLFASRKRKKSRSKRVPWTLSAAPEEIARKAGTEPNTVAVALRRVFGLRPKGECVFSHGEPLTGRWLTEFAERFCLRATDMERAFGFSSGWYTQATSAARQSNPLHRSKATVLATAERELLRRVTAVREFRDADVLRVVCPKLPEMCTYIAEAVREMPAFGSATNWLPQLVADSRRETASSPTRWDRRGFLCSLPGFIRFTKRFHDWRTKWAAPHELATAFLAFDYETSESTIREAIAERSENIPRLALQLAARAALEHLPKRGGRVGLDSHTAIRIRRAAAFLLCGYTQTTMARYLFGVGDDSQEESALQSTLKLFIRHRRRIELTRLSLSDHESRAIVARAVKTTTQRKPA